MSIMLWLLPFVVAITQVSIPSWRASCFPMWTVMEQCGSNIPRCHNKRMTNKPIAVLGKWSAHSFIYWAWTWWNIDSNHNIHPSYRPPNLSGPKSSGKILISMIAFQRRNLSPCFLIGGTIVFSVLLPRILKMTPFASFTTNSSNGVPCCNLLHGNADKLKRIHELRNESIRNAASLHDVLQKYRAWETNFYLRDEPRNKFEVARDDSVWNNT